MADDIVKVSEENDPNRCQGVGPNGQCWCVALPNTKFCNFHTGGDRTASLKRNYRLKQWQARVNEFADNSQVKNLREEIGVLRMLLEEMLAKCNSATDLMLHSQKIIQLVAQIEKLVVSCHKLEAATGILLDVDQVLRFADNFLEQLGRHVTDPRVLEEMAETVPKIIQQIGVSHGEQVGETAS